MAMSRFELMDKFCEIVKDCLELHSNKEELDKLNICIGQSNLKRLMNLKYSKRPLIARLITAKNACVYIFVYHDYEHQYIAMYDHEGQGVEYLFNVGIVTFTELMKRIYDGR